MSDGAMSIRLKFLRRCAAATVVALAALNGAAGAFAAPLALALEEVAPGIYVHAGLVEETSPQNQGDIANIGVVIGDDAVAVIDSGGSVAVARAALQAIRAVTDKPVRYLVTTHMHPDHVFGNQVFKAAGATLIGHHKLPAALAARADFYKQSMREQLGPALADEITVTLPDETVEGERIIDLGNRKLTLKAWGTAHTDNDLTVLDAATGTLFAGDLVFMEHVPVIDGSIKGWLAQTPNLEALPASLVVPGHGPASAPWPAAIADQTAYLERLASDLRQAIAEGVPLADSVKSAGRSEAGKWRVFDAFNARNSTAAFAELEWE